MFPRIASSPLLSLALRRTSAYVPKRNLNLLEYQAKGLLQDHKVKHGLVRVSLN